MTDNKAAYVKATVLGNASDGANQAYYTGKTIVNKSFELLTLDTAPGGAGWSAAETLTGVTSTETCVIVRVISPTTYVVKNRSGGFTLGEVITNGVDAADQGENYPTFAQTIEEVPALVGFTAVETDAAWIGATHVGGSTYQLRVAGKAATTINWNLVDFIFVTK